MSKRVICPSTTTRPKERSSRLSSDAKLGCSAIPSTAPPPAQRSTAWSRLPRSTAKSPIRGCATYCSGCRRLRRLKIMKPCCRGTVRQKCHGKPLTHHWVGGVYGAHTVDQIQKEHKGITPQSKAMTSEQQKIQELEARIARLEREKSILKKAIALLMSEDHERSR